MGLIWEHVEHRDRFCVSTWERNRITQQIRNFSQTTTDAGLEEARRLANITGSPIGYPMPDGQHLTQPMSPATGYNYAAFLATHPYNNFYDFLNEQKTAERLADYLKSQEPHQP